MSKKTLYIIFIAKFLFSISLITWTVMMTLGAGVGKDNDNTFMSYYKNVDEDFNTIISKNNLFQEKYIFELKINDFIVDTLTYDDIYLSQRVIQDRETRKNILHVGKNNLSIVIKDKITKQQIKNIEANVVFTMPSTHDFDQEVKLNSNIPQKDFIISKKSYWNIMGKIKVGNDTGNFYLKTNAI